MKHITVSLACLALILILAPFREAAGLYNEVIRVHILADDNSDEAQRVKLLVRDRVLVVGEKLLSGCEDREKADEILAANLSVLADEAEAVLRENGFDYGAAAALDSEYYERRDYDGFSLPAGTYRSLRISLGKGEGQNWWCVLFPRLCLRAAVTPSTMVEEGMSQGQASAVSTASGYTLRFRLLDWIGGWWK